MHLPASEASVLGRTGMSPAYPALKLSWFRPHSENEGATVDLRFATVIYPRDLPYGLLSLTYRFPAPPYVVFRQF